MPDVVHVDDLVQVRCHRRILGVLRAQLVGRGVVQEM
jgi:hypothetical protein